MCCPRYKRKNAKVETNNPELSPALSTHVFYLYSWSDDTNICNYKGKGNDVFDPDCTRPLTNDAK